MTQALNEQTIEAHLMTFMDDNLNKDVVSAGVLKKVEVSENQIHLMLTYPYPMLSQQEAIEANLLDHMKKQFPDAQCSVDISVLISAHQTAGGVKPLPQVKNIIAVASGKGGVGKSTVAVNLALALSQEGATVGILDADIYGPSQPIMLGLTGSQPETVDKKSIEPVENHGIQSMSIGYLIDESQATIWRGPMASGALQQLLNDTRWRDLDYLIVDLPPGTGDIQLTLAQKIPVTAAVIVTTPQNVAFADAKKAVAMFDKVNVPVLGVIENMAMHICSNCGHEEAIFGESDGHRYQETFDAPQLGSLPLDRTIREDCDQGKPTVVANPDHIAAQRYRELATKIGAKLAGMDRNFGAQFPTISILND